MGIAAAAPLSSRHLGSGKPSSHKRTLEADPRIPFRFHPPVDR
jgi:hypothetical protein